MTYRYGMRLRGFSIGCQPKDGLIKRGDDTSGNYYDILVYGRELSEQELEDYELDYLGKETEMKKYYIVDRISGYHDEDDMVYTKIAEARAERDRLNAERKAEGSTDDFWMVIDSKGNEVS